MALDIDHVHQMKREPGTNRLVMVGKNPYARLVRGGETPISVQGGKFYTDAGVRIPEDEVPVWARAEINKMSPRARVRIGLKEQGPFTEDLDQEEVQNLNGPEKGLSIDDSPLFAAVLLLDPSDDTHWTRDGRPSTKVLYAQTGRSYKREEIEEITQGYRRPDQED